MLKQETIEQAALQQAWDALQAVPSYCKRYARNAEIVKGMVAGEKYREFLDTLADGPREERAYWQLCVEQAEFITQRVREKTGDPTLSSVPLAQTYYEYDAYRCHVCKQHWQGYGTLFGCVHGKCVCESCTGKCEKVKA